MELDERDLELLSALKEDSSQSLRQLSKRTGIPMATVHHRIIALRRGGVILKYTVELDQKKMGLPVLAYMLIETDAGIKERDLVKIGESIAKIPEVKHVHILTGVFDIMAQVQVRDMEHLSQIVLRRIREVNGISKVNTMISMWGR